MPHSDARFPADGGCACRALRYRMRTQPLIVHCCHCTWCQRESGSAFALNAVIEADRVELLCGEVDVVQTPSASGRGQKIARCGTCRVALWSNYAQGGDSRFIRVGTLDDPTLCPPDIHIYASTRQPWVVLPSDARAFPEFYKPAEQWPPESLARWSDLRARGPAR